MTNDIVSLYEATFSMNADKLRRYILADGIARKSAGQLTPDIMYLDWSEGFFSLYRTTGNGNYFEIGKLVRKCAHRLHRAFIGMDEAHPLSTRFLREI